MFYVRVYIGTSKIIEYINAIYMYINFLYSLNMRHLHAATRPVPQTLGMHKDRSRMIVESRLVADEDDWRS